METDYESDWEEITETGNFIQKMSSCTDNIINTIRQLKTNIELEETFSIFLCVPKTGFESEWNKYLPNNNIPLSLDEMIDYINKHNPINFGRTLLHLLRNSEILDDYI